MAKFNGLNQESINISKLTPSTINIGVVKQYLSIEQDFTRDDILLQLCIDSSIDYVCRYTSLSIEELDTYIYMSIPILKIIGDTFEARGLIERKSNDVVLDKYLNMISTINI